MSTHKHTSHPDPGSIENVQVWETGASAYWRFFEGFFWYQRFHRRSKKSQTLGASEILLLCSKLNQSDALRFVKNHRRRSEICEIISKHLKSSLIYQKCRKGFLWFLCISLTFQICPQSVFTRECILALVAFV